MQKGENVKRLASSVFQKFARTMTLGIKSDLVLEIQSNVSSMPSFRKQRNINLILLFYSRPLHLIKSPKMFKSYVGDR